jgi:hypothetical protein
MGRKVDSLPSARPIQKASGFSRKNNSPLPLKGKSIIARIFESVKKIKNYFFR